MWILDELLPISQLIMLFPPKSSAPLHKPSRPLSVQDDDIETSTEDGSDD